MNLTLADLASLANQERVRLAEAGQLRAAHVWVAMKGSGRYIAAPEREEGQAVALAERCAGCDQARAREVVLRGAPVVALYCGEPFVEQAAPGPGNVPTCGCLVALRVGGRVAQAGKTAVHADACWAGRWPKGGGACCGGEGCRTGGPAAAGGSPPPGGSSLTDASAAGSGLSRFLCERAPKSRY